jgi:hypothetical protein
MKTAYELAMERLSKADPSVSLTAAQKAEIADLESRWRAKVAEREIGLEGEIRDALAAGDAEKAETLRAQLGRERLSMQATLEEKKQEVRKRKR